MLDLHSGFPYQKGNCENVKEITLVEQFVLENNGTFSKITNLFPSKIPIFRNVLLKRLLSESTLL